MKYLSHLQSICYVSKSFSTTVPKIAKLETEKTALMQKRASDIAKLRNGYQKEINAAIHRAEVAKKNITEKEKTIERQQKEIQALDRKANPQRYRLSSGAELLRVNVANYHHPSLHIWTRVGDALFEDTKFLVDIIPHKPILTVRLRMKNLSMLSSSLKNRLMRSK